MWYDARESILRIESSLGNTIVRIYLINSANNIRGGDTVAKNNSNDSLAQKQQKEHNQSLKNKDISGDKKLTGVNHPSTWEQHKLFFFCYPLL